MAERSIELLPSGAIAVSDGDTFVRTPERVRRKSGQAFIGAGAAVVTDSYPEGLVLYEGEGARDAWEMIRPDLVLGAPTPIVVDWQWIGHVWRSPQGGVLLLFRGPALGRRGTPRRESTTLGVRYRYTVDAGGPEPSVPPNRESRGGAADDGNRATAPIVIQRVENGALAAAILLVVLALGQPWWVLPAAFLVFDLSALGYLAGPRVGALTYNLVHNLAGPALVAIVAAILHLAAVDPTVPGLIAACWGFHVAADRALGYGLKLATFSLTHLGRIGRAR